VAIFEQSPVDFKVLDSSSCTSVQGKLTGVGHQAVRGMMGRRAASRRIGDAKHMRQCLVGVFLFQYGWGWTLSSGSLQDYPELHKPLGAPKGAFQRTAPEGWEFTREFKHASVWINTESRQAKITWR
jgi:hypothetical protein